MKGKYEWHRKHTEGYECSSKGDTRFSAMFAKLTDGRTIEQHYQCDVKGYNPKGLNWKLGKGKPPLGDLSPEELYDAYLLLWKMWAENNKPALRDLYRATKDVRILTDCFATSPVNQARALCDVMNKLIGESDD